MKIHLFIAYSNLHLMVAQAIAFKLPKEDKKILWLGTQVAGSNLLELYDVILVNEVWDDVEYIDYNRKINPPSLGRFFGNPLRTIREGCFAVEDMKKRWGGAGHPSHLWIAHQYDWVGKLAAVWIKRSRGNVHYYEEGLSVYLDANNVVGRGRFIDRVFRWGLAFCFSGMDIPRWGMGAADDVYLLCPETPTVFPHTLPVRSIKDYFNVNYIQYLVGFRKFGEAVRRNLENYPKEPFVLFINSVDVEDNYLSLPDYVESVRRGLDKSGVRGEVIVIKPHPRNRPEVLQALIAGIGGRVLVVVEEIPMPIETFAPLLNCKAIIGVSCSALVYLKVLYGMKTISISKQMLGGGGRGFIETLILLMPLRGSLMFCDV